MIKLNIDTPGSCSECPIYDRMYHFCPCILGVPSIQKDIYDNCKIILCKDCMNQEYEGRTGNIVCGITGEQHEKTFFCGYGAKQ